MAESLDQFVRDLVPPDASAGMDVTVPETESLPGHSVEALLACGGMGTVYVARQHGLDREVAVKVMTEQPGRRQTAERFRREAWVLGRLEHPNIVPIHEMGTDVRGMPFYTMKLVKGRTLQHIILALRNRDGDTLRHFSLAALLTVFRKVCDAMAFAHSNGVIHRDLKPENIMVGEFGEVLVMDWGLAKLLCSNKEIRMKNDEGMAPDCLHSSFCTEEDATAPVTLAGAVLGTPHYMSPEQAQGRSVELDERSDIYSLGCLLYAILTLRPPVEGTTLGEVLAKVREGRITSPSDLTYVISQPGTPTNLCQVSTLPHIAGGRVPLALSAVVMKALRLDPAERYASVTELSADIEAYQAGFATRAENASIWKQAALFVKRNKAASIGAAAVVVIGGGFGAEALVEGRRAEQALHELRLTAPVFQAQARLDFDEGRADEALRKIGYAIQLDGGNADYRLFRANLLQSSMQLAQAAEEYRRVLALRPGDADARRNLDLTEKWLRESGGGSLRREQQIELLVALREQKRVIESIPLAARLDPDPEGMKKTILRRVQAFTQQPGWGAIDRVGHLPNGMFALNLRGLQPRSLSVLEDMPIFRLELFEAAGSDISSLPWLPLRELNLTRAGVRDLTPLRGLPLETLNLLDTKVTDLSPLRGLPLKSLNLTGLNVKDLSPLQGMKLYYLNLTGSQLTDFSALRGMPLLYLYCSDCTNLADLEFVRGAPLKDFAVRGAKVASIEPLRGAPLKEVEIRACPVTDLSPLEDCPEIMDLDIRRSRVTDLRPVAKLKKLELLSLDESPVTDIEPLRGLPITYVRFPRTPLEDVSPLADCKELKQIILPPGVKNVETLRHLPKLTRISKDSAQDGQPMQTAEEFWKEFDATGGKMNPP